MEDLQDKYIFIFMTY